MAVPKHKRIVVKLGTSTLTAGTPYLSPPHIAELVRQMATLYQRGHEIILVSSGAMAAGRERLSFPKLPKEIPAKQMLSAVGQPRLMALYEQIFGLYSLTVAQVLLTRNDLANRRSYLNSRNTLAALLQQGVVPVVNENDTITTEEIRLGDNDNLSALVANLIEADLLVMLTDQPGIYTADPRQDAKAELVHDVKEAAIPGWLWEAAGGTINGLGTGGMVTKLSAADLARRAGTEVVIGDGRHPDILLKLVKGAAIGTRFTPVVTSLEGRKRYILAGSSAQGTLIVDAGAARALKKGGSLLPVGVAQILGEFERGDTVCIVDLEQQEIARGLANYSSVHLTKIQGQQSDTIESILGFAYGDWVIHHNDMVIL